MRDSNLPLRRAYIAKLSTPAITYNSSEVPVWYGEVPAEETAKSYIVIGQIDNNDISNKHKADTSTTIRVAIHTHNDVCNDGDACDTIAGIVMGRIYPVDKTQLDLSADNLQMVSTELSGDFLQDYQAEGQRKYLDRILTFRHHIFQR